jgi:phosphate starvation-inducible protein PhoH
MSKRKQRNNSSEHSLDQSFRLKKISPMTDTQQDAFDAYYENFNLFLYGVAGTGKTYISLYLALKEILNPNSPFRQVYVVRSSVPSRDMGFMPGKLQEKMQVYEAPYVGMINDLFGRGDAYEIVNTKNVFKMVSTSFLRGTTFENCIMIVDETQNMNYEELKTVITRCGNNSKIIFCGDVCQNDLYRSKFDTTGMPEFMQIISQMESFELIEFAAEDVVRSGICKEFILAELKLAAVNNSTVANL